MHRSTRRTLRRRGGMDGQGASPRAAQGDGNTVFKLSPRAAALWDVRVGSQAWLSTSAMSLSAKPPVGQAVSARAEREPAPAGSAAAAPTPPRHHHQQHALAAMSLNNCDGDVRLRAMCLKVLAAAPAWLWDGAATTLRTRIPQRLPQHLCGGCQFEPAFRERRLGAGGNKRWEMGRRQGAEAYRGGLEHRHGF